jgi:hypothetical protein
MNRNLLISKMLIVVSLTAVGVFWSSSVAAQFTYAKAGVGYSFLPIQLSGYLNNTTYSQFNVGVSGMHRPIQMIGIGVNIKFPVAHFSSFSFSEDRDYIGADYFDEWQFFTMSPVRERYKPEEYDYSFRQSAVFEIFGRLFIGNASTFFVDLKYSRSVLEEEFVLQRPFKPVMSTGGSNVYPAIEELDINEIHRHVLNAPGLTAGFFKHVSDYAYFDVGLSVDFIFLNQSGFAHDIEYDVEVSSSTPKIVRIESRATGFRPLLSLSIGFGLFF